MKLTARGAAVPSRNTCASPAHLRQFTLHGSPLDAAALAALRDTYGDRLRFTPAPPPPSDDVDD